MGNLYMLFEDLRANKGFYLGSTKGRDFEDRLGEKLHELGYSRIVRRADMLKVEVLDKFSERGIINPFSQFRRHFILQPYGSQNYPDFLVLDDDRVVCMEVKFSQRGQKSPVWNSGLPRANGVYIFGAAGAKADVTFFLGSDVVSVDDAKKLHEFFDKLRALQREFNQKEMGSQPYGFSAYVRKAFEQKVAFNKDASLDFFKNQNRKTLEDAVITHLLQPFNGDNAN